MEKTMWDHMQQDIMNADIPETERNKLLKNFLAMKEQKINIMITGATGCGKSSTINALFNADVAKVGTGPDPETMDIKRFDLSNLILWDTPGLGDGKEPDKRHAKNIINKLNELDDKGNLLIDLVLVILDGGSRDMGTSYELINQVIIPNLGENKKDRLLVAINQADMAMKGRGWNFDKNQPQEVLSRFLDEKADSVRKRIREATGVDTQPICYSAGYKDEFGQNRPWNLSKLLYHIIRFTPKEKRISYVENINRDADMWKDNDDLRDYGREIRSTFADSFLDSVRSGSEIGGEIGSIFGGAGKYVGSLIGGVVGGAANLVTSAVDKFTTFISGGGCYITTAICEEQHKSDDCYELTLLRDFRDHWLKYQPGGKELIRQYYDIAPTIVANIAKQPNHSEIYQQINEQYLKPCIHLIESGNKERCKELYIEMVEDLQERQKQWQ